MYRSAQHGRRLLSLRPCRLIANRRYPDAVVSSARHFSCSRWLTSPPNDPNEPRDPPGDASTSSNGASSPAGEAGDSNPPSQDLHETRRRLNGENEDVKEQGVHGSAFRRAQRNKAALEAEPTPPPVTIPSWFWERNTAYYNAERQDPASTGRHVRIVESKSDKTDGTQPDESGEGDKSPGQSESEEPTGSESRYALTDTVWEELRASVKAGMRLPPAKYASEPSAVKSHLSLQTQPSGILFLDAVVGKLAHEVGANHITLNAQDICQLCSEQDLAHHGNASRIRSLSYQVYRPSLPQINTGEKPKEEEQEEHEEIEEEDLDEGDGETSDSHKPNLRVLGDLTSRFTQEDAPSRVSQPFMLQRSPNKQQSAPPNAWRHLAEELLSLPGVSTQASATNGVGSDEAAEAVQTRGLIVHVQDYGNIKATAEGARFLSALQRAIRQRRNAGSRVMMIGSTEQNMERPDSAEDIEENLLKPLIMMRQPRRNKSPKSDTFSKNLLITPAMTLPARQKTWGEDGERRILDINIRHLQSMLRARLSEDSSATKDDIFGSRNWPLDPATVKDRGLGKRFWLPSEIHWATTLALGCCESGEPFGFEHIERGIELMRRSDSIKNEWLRTSATSKNSKWNKELAGIRRSCTPHESQLLSGVIDASDISTTYSDVHVPPDTLEAVQTLTSLSLVRPDAFTYGVLATNKIPGLLMYGPPGTGKTLLARAVARESKVKVLSISGSSLNQMFVGEGEKNVRAVFTLAKKLGPCIVFIDEADSILGRRKGVNERGGHREMINEFLKEWDSMNSLSAFIMVATNRPFDMDDAVLRRLPRRLLVDLPTEQDRLAILKIHLKDEALDPSVDLASLASRTPLYSGSDLKNLSVAAALACVREENEAAKQREGDEAEKYPSKRTLTGAHFERALGEISASINEDMSSMAAIKKFDEQYGDRKNRRKKQGYGFTPPGAEPENADERARVRS